MLTPECHTTSAQYRIFIIQATEKAISSGFGGFAMICICACFYSIIWAPPSVISVLQKTLNHCAQWCRLLFYHILENTHYQKGWSLQRESQILKWIWPKHQTHLFTRYMCTSWNTWWNSSLGKQCKHARVWVTVSILNVCLYFYLLHVIPINGVSLVLVYSCVVVYKDLPLRKVEVSYLYGWPTVTVLLWQFQWFIYSKQRASCWLINLTV